MKLSLATRIFLGYAAVLVTYALVSAFSVLQMGQNQVEIRLVSQGYLQLSQNAAEIETHHKNLERETERLLDEANVEKRRSPMGLRGLYPPSLAQTIEEAQAKANEILGFAPPSEARFGRELDQKRAGLPRRYAEYEEGGHGVSKLREANTSDKARTSQQVEQFKQLQASIGRDIRLLRISLNNQTLDRVNKAEQRERRTGLLIIGGSIFAIVVGLLATAFSTR